MATAKASSGGRASAAARSEGDKIFEQTGGQAARDRAKKFYGGMFRPNDSPATAPRSELRKWAARVEKVNAEAERGGQLKLDMRTWGKSMEELRNMAGGKAKSYRRRAGVRALVAKYGAESAARIVRRQSGRTIREWPA